MLKVKLIIPAVRIAAKIDVDAIIKKIGQLDCFDASKGKKDVLAQLKEHSTEVGLAIIPELLKQVINAADEIPALIAAYENCTVEEAAELDAVEEFKKLAAEAGIRDFFASALKGKSGVLT